MNGLRTLALLLGSVLLAGCNTAPRPQPAPSAPEKPVGQGCRDCRTWSLDEGKAPPADCIPSSLVITFAGPEGTFASVAGLGALRALEQRLATVEGVAKTCSIARAVEKTYILLTGQAESAGIPGDAVVIAQLLMLLDGGADGMELLVSPDRSTAGLIIQMDGPADAQKPRDLQSMLGDLDGEFRKRSVPVTARGVLVSNCPDGIPGASSGLKFIDSIHLEDGNLSIGISE